MGRESPSGRMKMSKHHSVEVAAQLYAVRYVSYISRKLVKEKNRAKLLCNSNVEGEREY